MLLSIVIPAYDRPGPLRLALDTFVSQIEGRFESDVEIVVTDDASPRNAIGFVEEYAQRHRYIRFNRLNDNIGLERNLIKCTVGATGEFLWIFGDDDYLETDDALSDVIARLRRPGVDMLVLNRARRSRNLRQILSDDWMRLRGSKDRVFPGLREFCLEFGFISVVGFVSVNIFRREPFQAVRAAKYFGTMYPQLGAMMEAFHARPVELVARPLVCHRTQTQGEKNAALGAKASESDFVADVERRNALYFGQPYVWMVEELVRLGAFSPADVVAIKENTVIDGLMIDFLLQCVEKSKQFPDRFGEAQWRRTLGFLDTLPLPSRQRDQLDAMIKWWWQSRSSVTTISVVSPSFNQAEFLDDCLRSVRDQTHKPIEHFVYDPGSKDGSREVAARYSHVTLLCEPDKGQSDALNKGFKRVQGDIVAWLNSDDMYADEAVFARVIKRFNQPDAPDIVYGRGVYVDTRGNTLRDAYINTDPSSLHWRLHQGAGVMQPAVFMRRSVIEKMGELNGGLHYCMDYEYWIRCLKEGMKFAFVDDVFAIARYHRSNKTYGLRGNSFAEVCDMLVAQFGYASHVWLRRYAEFLSDGFDGVLANAGNTAVESKDKLEAIYRSLLKAYNTGALTYELLTERASQKGWGDTLRELQALGLARSTPCREVPLDCAHQADAVLRTVGPRRWAFNTAWKKQQIEKTHAFLREEIAKRDKDVCVIVGNGPSLKKVDLGLLEGQDVIISNNAFLAPKLLDSAKYYTVVNYLVAEQSAHNINQIAQLKKVLPYWLAYCLNEGDNSYFIDAAGHAEFSKDIFKNLSWRHTVTFYNLHLAFGLGYRRAVLIGFDHSYQQAASVKEGDIILSKSEDQNHFDPRYFQGKKWQAADVNMMEEMYRLAKAAYEEEGREIINATAGGALELFPRMALEDALLCTTGG